MFTAEGDQYQAKSHSYHNSNHRLLSLIITPPKPASTIPCLDSTTPILITVPTFASTMFGPTSSVPVPYPHPPISCLVPLVLYQFIVTYLFLQYPAQFLHRYHVLHAQCSVLPFLVTDTKSPGENVSERSLSVTSDDSKTSDDQPKLDASSVFFFPTFHHPSSPVLPSAGCCSTPTSTKYKVRL